MLSNSFVIGDLIRYLGNPRFEELLTKEQIKFIQDSLTAYWTFTP